MTELEVNSGMAANGTEYLSARCPPYRHVQQLSTAL